MDEFRLIERLLRHPGARAAGVRVGPGDDAAVLRPPSGAELVVTTDAQIESVHFNWDWLTPADVGYRAAMACHSDLAAMGARPWTAFSSLSIPARMTTTRVTAIQRGLDRAFRELGAALAGGNVARATDAFSITLTAIGLAPAGRTTQRIGASAGDSIWCSGHPGLAALGRHELAAGRRRTAAARAFRRPVARIALGRALSQGPIASAMIDISDGVAGDLAHLLGGRHGATLERAALLADATFAARCHRVGQEPEEVILGGGEDYELLFTVPGEVRDSRVQAAGGRAGTPVRRIGEVSDRSGIHLVGAGRADRVVRPVGFRHEVATHPGRSTRGRLPGK